MSASLVGSEMCIRDRTTGIPIASGMREPRQRLTRPSASPGRPQSKPVSYTHLTLPTICSV
eukprot:9760440-Alexandrium_andersonii.AAC.1